MASNTAPSFIASHTGFTSPDNFPGSFYLHNLTLTADGRLIGAGPNSIVRLNPDGSMQSNVGSGPGPEMGSAGSYVSASGDSFKLMPDNKVVIGGSWNTYPENKPSGYVLYRLNVDGTLDKTFAKGKGWASTNPGDIEDPAGMLQAPDGKFLIVGTSGTGPLLDQPNNFISISRFSARGEVDLTFGEQGSVLIPDDNVYLTSVRMQSDGKILAAGSHKYGRWNESVIYRINPDGSLDSSFGSGGKASFTFDSAVSSVEAFTVQPDGKIVAACWTNPDKYSGIGTVFGVVRLNADGSLDREFGTDGKTSVYPGPQLTPAQQANGDFANGYAESVLVRQDGSIVVAGSLKSWIGGKILSSQFGMVALRPNGEIDSSFGTSGAVTAPPREGETIYGGTVVEMPDGRLLLSGSVELRNSVAIYSFNADGSPDLNFGAAGTASGNAITYKEGHAAIALNAGISVHDNELAATNYLGASLKLERHGGANAADIFEAGGKLSFAGGNVTIGGTVVGTVQGGSGSLRIDFNADANEALVNLVLRNISYRNNSDLAQDASVRIDWIFSDAGPAGSAPLDTKASTEVKLLAGQLPSWIEPLLNSRDPAALREELLSYLGAGQTLNVSYLTDGSATPFSQADQEAIDGLLASIAAVSGIKFGTDSTPGSDKLEIHSSAEIASGKMAYAALTGNGGDLYLGKPAAGTLRSLLPELNQHLLQVLGLDGDSALSTNLSQAHIAALQYLYGPNTAARAGNDTYRLSELLPHMLWDGGGIDTIDGSGLTKDLTLHLEAGHWDYVGSKGAGITSSGQITVNFGSTFENANGGSGNDKLFGTAGDNVLRGGAGNDTITGNGGDDSIDGGGGLDTANFSGKRSAYEVSANAKGFTVSGADGLAALTGVERLHFTDGDKALDIDGKAGQLFRLYQAIFNRKPDEAGLGYWLKAVDNGISMESVALEFTKSAEFAKMYGVNVSNKEMLTKIYDYALHRLPDNDGFAWWLDVLDNKKASLGTVLYGFSESKENYAQVIGSMQHGIDYIAYQG